MSIIEVALSPLAFILVGFFCCFRGIASIIHQGYGWRGEKGAFSFVGRIELFCIIDQLYITTYYAMD